MFDTVVVGVVRQPRHKETTMFTVDERIGFIRESVADLENVQVEGFATLVVEFARAFGARAIVKGLRAVSDFEWEFQMNNLNRGLAEEIETLYLMASPKYSFLSSRGVREIASFGGSVDDYVRSGRSSEVEPREIEVDVLVLIDKLDELVLNARGVPMSNQVRLDRDEIEDIISHMRATIPEEIKQARWIVKERQEMLAEAKREAERMIGEARDHAAREASQQEVVKLAERQAEDVLADARRKAREMRLGADDYADSILENMETNLTKFLSAVQRGREQLSGRGDDNTDPATAGFDLSHTQ
jgi:pantetheine-phosphate adenylyltransferase